ncbi:hypothetical protein AOH238_06340 [Helicobacter pylori]|nr:hypothetical protein OHP006_13480 [Helicobacter pylori]
MKKIEWNEKQRKAFQDLLREFVALIDTKAQEKKQTGSSKDTKVWFMPKRTEQVFNAMGLCVQNQSWLWELIQ